MTEQEYEEKMAAARAECVALNEREAKAKAANLEAVERYTAWLNNQTKTNQAERYEFRRQIANQEGDWQPVPPGPEWDLWTFFESDQTLAYYWRRPLPDRACPIGMEASDA